MQVRTEDYRLYNKEYHGRTYKIFRIYTNNLHSIMTNNKMNEADERNDINAFMLPKKIDPRQRDEVSTMI